MRYVAIVLSLAFFGFANPTRCRAVDLVQIIVESTSIDVNDPFKDISVTLFNPKLNDVNIAAFSVNLKITPVSPRYVEFDANTQPDTLGQNAYIFFGNSAAVQDATTPWNVVSQAGVNDVYTFVDTTADTLNMPLGAGQTRLLAKVRLKPGTSIAGDVFGIGIVPVGTGLIDADFATVDFAGFAAVLTVVPEPHSIALGMISGVTLVVARRRRKLALAKRTEG